MTEAAVPPPLKKLRAAERDLLTLWARGTALKRQWLTLLNEAGLDRLELAEALADKLAVLGIARVQTSFDRGLWSKQQLEWLDLASLQAELGLRSKSEGDAQRNELRAQLRALESETPGLMAAAQLLAETRGLKIEHLKARNELLQGLAQWCAEQQRGMRQDFALQIRPSTKAVSDSEWEWLEKQFDLDVLGIERFAPVVWLSTERSLRWPQARLDGAAFPFIGVPAESIAQVQSMDRPPEAYWLIENRASFERQSRQRAAGICIVWLPGRPSKAWQAAIRHLLTVTPAPARISADADPAGIEIALTAGALWNNPPGWEAWAMEPERLKQGKALPLNTYDRQTLARLKLHTEVPDRLRALAEAIEQTGCKAEQEGWL